MVLVIAVKLCDGAQTNDPHLVIPCRSARRLSVLPLNGVAKSDTITLLMYCYEKLVITFMCFKTL
jgi:hypothetical protein